MCRMDWKQERLEAEYICGSVSFRVDFALQNDEFLGIIKSRGATGWELWGEYTRFPS